MTFSVLILFLLKFYIVSSFDPSSVNYCDHSCNGEKHTACECKVQPPRELNLRDMDAFRQKIIDIHNEYRNKVASGQEEEEINEFVKPASNMRVMNYDLELEYIATCLAGKFKEHHDQCRNKHKGDQVGQNLAGSSVRNEDLGKMIASWYVTNFISGDFLSLCR